jgi:phytoene dehydrogenase-like protein
MHWGWVIFAVIVLMILLYSLGDWILHESKNYQKWSEEIEAIRATLPKNGDPVLLPDGYKAIVTGTIVVSKEEYYVKVRYYSHKSQQVHYERLVPGEYTLI